MSLDAALNIASSGLDSINRRMALVSHNVANAGTAGYVRETAVTTSQHAGGRGMGVRTGPALRELDERLQAEVFHAGAAAAGLETRSAALAAIDAVAGAPGSGQSLPDLLGTLRDSLSALSSSPESSTGQRQVVAQADALARGVNALAAEGDAQRQGAQDAVVADVGDLNATLRSLGGLSDRIMRGKAEGASTADLEGERDAQMARVSSLVDSKFLRQANGDLLVLTGGLSLPLRSANGPFAISNASLGPAVSGAAAPRVTLDGLDVTAQLKGGRIGANLELRDRTLPTMQAELDEFANTVATRFEAQGLRLFTGTPPSPVGTGAQAGYVGLAQAFQVNPAVLAAPQLVRDGTHAVGGFIPNPPGGPAGFTGLARRVLDGALGTTPALTAATGGLGPDGTLRARFAVPRTLAEFATSFSAAQAQESSESSVRLDVERGAAAALQSRLDEVTGVSVDAEMADLVRLQGAYAANARVIAAAQTMWDQLLNSVR